MLYWLYRSAWSALKLLLSKRWLFTFFQVAFQPSPWRASAPCSTIQAHAEARGESVNGFINRAIDHEMERDNAVEKQPEEP